MHVQFHSFFWGVGGGVIALMASGKKLLHRLEYLAEMLCSLLPAQKHGGMGEGADDLLCGPNYSLQDFPVCSRAVARPDSDTIGQDAFFVPL